MIPRANRGPSTPANVAPTDPSIANGHSDLFNLNTVQIDGVDADLGELQDSWLS